MYFDLDLHAELLASRTCSYVEVVDEFGALAKDSSGMVQKKSSSRVFFLPPMMVYVPSIGHVLMSQINGSIERMNVIPVPTVPTVAN